MGDLQGYAMPVDLAKKIKPMPAEMMRLITIKQLNTQAYWVRPVITGARPTACPCCGAIHPMAAHGVCGGCYEPTIKKGLYGHALLDHLAKRAKCGKKIRPSGPKVISGLLPGQIVGEFIEAECTLSPPRSVPAATLYWAFCLWLKDNPDKGPLPSQKYFNQIIMGGDHPSESWIIKKERREGRYHYTGISLKDVLEESISPAQESSSPAATPLAGAGQVESEAQSNASLEGAAVAVAIRIAMGLDSKTSIRDLPPIVGKLVADHDYLSEEMNKVVELLSPADDEDLDQTVRRMASEASSVIQERDALAEKFAKLTEEVANLNRLLASEPSRGPNVEPWKTCETILQLLGLDHAWIPTFTADCDLGLMTAGLISSAICDGTLRIENGALRFDPIQTQELIDQDIVAKWSALPVPDGYEALTAVLHDAIDQASLGKGLERHADDRPFHDQPILRETQAVGLGFPAGQARKKILEAVHCCDDHPERAVADLLGAINYTAAMVIAIRSMMVEHAAA